MVRVEILAETRRAWTYFFEYPQLIFALFFLFFYLISKSGYCVKDTFQSERGRVGKGIKFRYGFYTLSWICFLRMPEFSLKAGCSLQSILLWKREASSKNNALNCRVGGGSSAGKGIIFYLLKGGVLIAFMDSWCHLVRWWSQSQFTVKVWEVPVWHRLS